MGASASKEAHRIEIAKRAGQAAAAEVLEGVRPKAKQGAGPEPELIYFDGLGRGELTRLAFAAGNVAFVDTRVKEADWPTIKNDPESVPAKCFGSMPCLKHGETLVAQSRATATYAAELGIWAQGRLGGNATDVAINGATEMMVLGAHADLQAAMFKCLFGDEESKANGKKDLPEGVKPTLDGLERALGRKTCSGPFFFCEKGPTLADLAVYDVVESSFPGLKALGIDMTPYPKLCAVADAVRKDALVSGYIARASMGKPELIYFNLPGRAQLTRLAFAAGGIEFTDTRIEQPDWPAIKSDPESTPAKCFGSMPCIKHGEVLLAQSEATATYAAQLGIWKTRLGTDSSEQAANRATEMMILGAHADLQSAMYKCLFGDDESKAKGKESLPASVRPTLDGLERILGRKTHSGPFFFCEVGPTLADLAVYDFVESPFPGLKALDFDLTPYPKVCAVASAVAADAQIKENFKP